jgi:hypothetical protein
MNDIQDSSTLLFNSHVILIYHNFRFSLHGFFHIIHINFNIAINLTNFYATEFSDRKGFYFFQPKTEFTRKTCWYNLSQVFIIRIRFRVFLKKIIEVT